MLYYVIRYEIYYVIMCQLQRESFFFNVNDRDGALNAIYCGRSISTPKFFVVNSSKINLGICLPNY